MPGVQPDPRRSPASGGIRTNFQPERFGRYYLLDRVATGGMAEVFRAKTFSEAGFEKLLVIKRILQHLSGNEEFVEMFIDEAKISSELHHPNIVQIYDFGRERDNYYIAMEYVEGRDVKNILRRLAERRRTMPPEYAAYIAHEVARGLDYAHTKTNLRGEPMNIVHRDVSPSNVLVSFRGDVKLADFGIAKAENTLYDTKAGVLKGKFEYMSPEQASGEEVTPQSDVFSAGIVLHEMLTGRRLFKTDSDVKTLERIKAADVRPPSAINPSVPRRLDEIVMRALARDPADRFPDARALQAALHEFLAPATPDVVRESLSFFLGELFGEDIVADRQRLEAATALAQQMHEEGPPPGDREWESATGASATLATQPARWPMLLAGVILALLLAVVALFVVLRLQPAPPEQPAAPVVTTGQLHLVVRPAVAARVFLDGREIGPLVDGTLVWNDVPADTDVALRVEADGYEPFEDTVRVAAGERLRLPIRLQALAPPEPEAEPEPVEAPARPPRRAPRPATVEPAPARPGVARFDSTPSGATVIVDGRRVGTTPTTWTEGEAGRRYRVRVEKRGYQPSSFTITFPEDGTTDHWTATLEPEPAAAEPGRLTVNVRGGWAKVYVDGTYVDDTPLVDHAVPAGTHTIRVVNEATGVDETRTVTVGAGAAEKVIF